MPWYPGAVRRPINRNYTRRKTAKNANILHTDAGNSYDLYGWWMNPANTQASSHFHVAKDGKVFQYIDTDHISWASGAANTRSISYETQGYGTEAWTPAQLAALVKVLRWASEAHGIPIRQMRSSAVSEKGIGWHRQGVNGNFPSGLLGGVRQNGGQVWSSAVGKSCPGPLRIQQIPGIVRQLQNPIISPAATTPTGGLTVSDVKKLEDAIHNLPARVWDQEIVVQRSSGPKAITSRTALQNADAAANASYGIGLSNAGRIAALEDTVSQLATGTGVAIDYDRVQDAARAGTQEAIAAGIEVEGTVELKQKEN